MRKKNFLVLIAALAVSVNFSFAQKDCALVSGDKNIVRDGTFESVTTELDVSLADFGFAGTWGNAGWGKLRIMDNAADAYCGNRYAFMAPDGGDLVCPVSWEPEETYVLQAWIKTTGDTFEFTIVGADLPGAGSNDSYSVSIPDSKGEWELFEFEFISGIYAGTIPDGTYPDGGFKPGNFVSVHAWWGEGRLSLDNWEIYKKSDVPGSGMKKLSDNNINIFGTTGAVVINSGLAESISIYSITGKILKQEIVSGKTTIPITAGMYIVKAGNKVNKVIVK